MGYIKVHSRVNATKLTFALFFIFCAAQWVASAERPAGKGVVPISAWECPSTHRIKGNFTTYSGERCIYHVPGGRFYDKTKPERCYATPGDAKADGCRASKR